jgi:hypothetical protein
MPGYSDTLAELCLPWLARSLLIGICLSSSLPSAMRLVAPDSPSGFNATIRVSTASECGPNGFKSAHCALFVRHVRTQLLLKLKCKTNIPNNITAMPFNLRRIVCPTEAFHPTCCSNASIARALKTATRSIRSLISRMKSRRCSTRRSGHADGSTRAVDDDNALRYTRRPRDASAGAIKRVGASQGIPS